MITHLGSADMMVCTQQALEEYVTTAGRELQRQLMQDQLDAVPAGKAIRAGQAACSYSFSTPPTRSRRWMFRRASRSESVIGSGSGASGRALAMP
jgi:hypothetical protein